MRILFHHRIASRDGQAVHLEELIAALQRQGHETMLVGPPRLLTTGFGGSNPLVDSIKRSVPRALYEMLEIAYNLKAFLRLRAAVRAFHPDVIYERFSLFLFAGIWVRRLYKLPMLLEVNSPLYEERTEDNTLHLRWLGCRAQRLLWSRADHVLPVTGVLARTVAAYGAASSRITVIPNGVNLERFGVVPDASAAKAELRLPPRLILGFIGFIRSWNAVHRLIDFVAQHHTHIDLHVLVVGDGPSRDFLEEYARSRRVFDRLTITGIVERDDVARHIAAFDIAVVPGMNLYASPLKLFEYLQLGRAIVAPDTENIREVLTDGQDALLFDPGREGAMESSLLRLCSDAALRARLGVAARRTIAEKSLTWNRNAERVLEIAEALVSQSRGATQMGVQVGQRSCNVGK